ncbi:MAG: hypothetical protein IJH04_10215, partial [Eggerthellaceae bacterium]|nr:hypothetical protein [Eggerthellaceae bacterium]
LLFAEMASLMDLPHLALLGHELCGSFSRNPDDPCNGNSVFGVAPVTSVHRIGEFLESAKWLRGMNLAWRSLECVSDNAWSPMEAIVSLMANMPESEFGYGMGRCVLNARVDTRGILHDASDASTRVPDILFGDVHVGLNYDGQGHLELYPIVDAAISLSKEPQNEGNRTQLGYAISNVREKAVDDLRRNRELAASGFIVLPVTKEDLYRKGGLDRVMAEVCAAIEAFDRKDMGRLRNLLAKDGLRMPRQRLIWSLLPHWGA